MLSGSIFIGEGDMLDESASEEIVVGGMVVIPATCTTSVAARMEPTSKSRASDPSE